MASRPRRFGRYLVFEAFARGGMASVCFGKVTGAVGFSRVVAVKRTHAPLAKDPDFVSMMVDEGRLAGRIRHPSVVPVLDVVQQPGELLLVMDYVDGLSLAKLWRRAHERGEKIPLRVAVAVLVATLQGLHAAHELRDDRGELAGLVHRDVSPQNILVGRDGLARVTDFGIALARERLQFTRTEELKGKLEYMAREQLRRERVDRRTDVYAASLVLWELVTGQRPFAGDTDRMVMQRISTSELPRPGSVAPELAPELDALIARGISPTAAERFATALEMAEALERVVTPASQMEVARWVAEVAGEELDARARRVAEIEAFRDQAQTASEETLVGAAGADDEGPTLVEPEPEPRPESQRVSAPVDPTLVAVAPATETRTNAVRNVTPTAQRRDRLVWALPLVAFALGAVLLGAVAITRLRPDEVRVESVPVPVLPALPVPSGTLAPATASTALVAPPPSAGPVPAVAAPSASVSKPPRPIAPRPVAKPNCDPPYTVDAQGVRVPKRECFAR